MTKDERVRQAIRNFKGREKCFIPEGEVENNLITAIKQVYEDEPKCPICEKLKHIDGETCQDKPSESEDDFHNPRVNTSAWYWKVRYESVLRGRDKLLKNKSSESEVER